MLTMRGALLLPSLGRALALVLLAGGAAAAGAAHAGGCGASEGRCVGSPAGEIVVAQLAPEPAPDAPIEELGEADAAAVPSDACPAGTAVVRTPEGLDFLNVRDRPSTKGTVIAQLPDGSDVAVAGACLQPAAGFAKGNTLKPKAEGGGSSAWCRIEEPEQGCVNSAFLRFGKELKPAAGLAKKKTAREASFEGQWSAIADDVDYTMRMEQKGDRVSGEFEGADGSRGTFRGRIKGKVLRFTWQQDDGHEGSGKFILAADGDSFRGSYNFGKDPDESEGSWNGRRE